MTIPADFNLSCPIPIQQYPTILLAHGGGGKLMHQLIEQMFLPTFGTCNGIQHDAATLTLSGQRMAFTTDSYVVQPLFFPGGDIGSLAVNGTVNDLAMAGARPLYLSVGFILEEGLPMETLWRVVRSMQQAAEAAKVQIVTGDTKVVDRGKGDGMFINTAGIGVVEHAQLIAPQSVRAGDGVLLNGDLGRHGIAVMSAREGLAFETTIASDSAPLSDLVLELLAARIEIHCLRDLTRGGLASALNEIALAARVTIAIDETQIPVCEEVQGACEILGLDPLYVANEGRLVVFVHQSDVEKTLEIMREHQKRYQKVSDLEQNFIAQSAIETQACIIGNVTEQTSRGIVTLKSKIGMNRLIDLLSGEQLPRIC
ncbi:MAG: hydrogenase expression/formation protein HypE [Cyanobacteria bacterium RU_5_0]|nr:hydrogenase expression/formation protein HypE [Cyanobacteria bacterium RU_5_0]